MNHADAKIIQADMKAEFLKLHQREGEIYAGLVLGKNGEPDYHLFLLPGQANDVTWADAGKWAEKAGGALPDRRESRLLMANLGELFEQRYYWTSEQRAGDSDYAWVQLFNGGYQGYNRKSGKCRARAVRRLVLQ